MVQVATHKDAASCWTAIDGNVYDLTTWIPQHPGGEAAIESICGIDGTSAFHGQHDDAKRQADILATFKIGTLAQ
jgi:cytochrome b involved in lipid metabolism